MADVAVLNVLLYVVDNGHKAPGRGRNSDSVCPRTRYNSRSASSGLGVKPENDVGLVDDSDLIGGG